MSWLRGGPLRASFRKPHSRDSPPNDADPSACYDSFCKHWQQTHEIIGRSRPPDGRLSHDEIRGVVNHVDQMVTLLLLELRKKTASDQFQQAAPTHSPCLEYLLSENLLDALFELSTNAGRYTTVLRLKQLKLHELLISYSSSLLAHEPVARPVLKFLEACATDILEDEVEKRLISFLNQLCVAITQNIALLDLFFQPNATGKKKFIIFNLLIPHIHREGPLGPQARDAMLLCMSLSRKNDQLGLYIAHTSNVCPVLATGLSGLYSVLPRKLSIDTDDWHRLTPDDVNEIPELAQLMDSLEFCNAVTQVAHPSVRNQLLEFLYQGFLVPVMGPALFQDSLGLTLDQLDAPDNRTTVEELVSATAYFDLFLRSVTDPGLLRSLVRFLLEDDYDLCRILDTLIQRISSRSRLCIVTLALFESLVDLNCEDVMLELCLGALGPCSHIMFSQRRRLRDVDSFGRAAEKFLSLAPACCVVCPSNSSASSSKSLNHMTFDTRNSHTFSSQTSNTIINPRCYNSFPALVNYGSKHAESLYGNYHAYLYDARRKIVACQIACSNWSYRYDGEPRSKTKISIDDDSNCSKTDEIHSRSNDSDASTFAKNSSNPNSEIVEVFGSSMNNETSSCVVKNVIYNFYGDNVDASTCRQTTKNICENVDSSPAGVPTIDEITFARDSINKDERENGERNGGSMSAEERSHLDADIAELLGDDPGTIVKTNDDETEIRERAAIDCRDDVEDSNATTNSLRSMGESSGYESFALRGSTESTPENEHAEESTIEGDTIVSNDDEDSTMINGSVETNEDPTITCEKSIVVEKTKMDIVTSSILSNDLRKNNISLTRNDAFDGKPNVGMFLDVLLRKLESMTSNNVYVNLQLTGLISRLAIYPQPLLQSFLLNHSLVFQPSVRSLLQVLASLKHKIDQYLSKIEDLDVLVGQARNFLIAREDRLVNARKNALEAAAQAPQMKQHVTSGEPFSRSEPKRRSLLGQVLDWSGGNSSSASLKSSLAHKFGMKEESLEVVEHGSGYKYYPRMTWDAPKDVSPDQNVVLCAVVMDEWLKELAAITQEHAIQSLTSRLESRV